MRLASRLPSSLQPTPFAARLEVLRAQGRMWDLTLSNPTRCGLAYPEVGLRQAMGAPTVLRYAPDPAGDLEARQAVTDWLCRRPGVQVRPSEVVLTASTSEAYSWLFKLLADPGEEVLVPSPSYPLFEWLARLEGLRAVGVGAWFHERWNLDLEALGAACNPRTRLLVLVNPNNPTGQYLTQEEWAQVTRFCAERRLALLVDEVFSDYPLEPPPEALPTVLEDPEPACPVFVLSGLSKVAALPQVKLGWIVLRGGALEGREALHFLADQYLSVSASAQAACGPILEAAPDIQSQLRSRTQGNLLALDAFLRFHPHLGRLPVEGGWSVLLRRPAVDSDEACALRLLENQRVLVQPGHLFDIVGDGHLVLSLLPEPGLFLEGLERMGRGLV